MSTSVSQTQATDARVAATDQATVIQAKGKSNVGGLNITNKGKGSQVTLQTGIDPSVLGTLGETLADNFARSTAALTNTFASGSTQLASTIGKSIDTLGEMAQTQQTGGVSQLSKTFLWIVGGTLALLALIFIFSRK